MSRHAFERIDTILQKNTNNNNDEIRRLKEFIRVSNNYFIATFDLEVMHTNIKT